LAAEDAKGNLKTSAKDYLAATFGLCEITPAPANLGDSSYFFHRELPRNSNQQHK
jgi:hypothetical protein